MSESSASALPFARAVLLAGSQPGERVLDLSGRAGVIALQVAETAASVEAVQPDEELAAEGRRLAISMGRDNVYFHAGPRHSLPFDPGQFDLVFWCLGLADEPYPLRTMTEIARVLAPSGRLVLQEVVRFGRMRLALHLRELERRRNPQHLLFYSDKEMEALLALGGLRATTVERSGLTQDFDYWADTAGTGQGEARALKTAFLSLSPEDQLSLDLSLADQRISFVYPLVTMVASVAAAGAPGPRDRGT